MRLAPQRKAPLPPRWYGRVMARRTKAAAGHERRFRDVTKVDARILEIVRTDSTFERVELRGGEEAWQGRCIHCGAHLVVSAMGRLLGSATVEHIVPRTHGGTDELENLALACAACNHQKGCRQDNRRADDPGLKAVVDTLQRRRRERWR